MTVHQSTSVTVVLWTSGILLASLLLSVESFTVSPSVFFSSSVSLPTTASSSSSNTRLFMRKSQLAQLADMTTLSIDSGDLKVIETYAKTGFITDATTNPLFVSQAGLSGDPTYAKLVDDAVAFALSSDEYSMKDEKKGEYHKRVALAIDKLAVNLGAAIADIVPGYISTEVDPRLSFDTEASVSRALRIIDLYRTMGVPKERVLIKLAATWEGILAAEILENQGITCNLTLIFSFVQAVACAQYGAHLISPFPGRILDWNKNASQRTEEGVQPEDDEGVIAVKKMYNYYKQHNHDTICMPASWRPSRGAGYDLDEIRELAGVDRMTIPAPLLEKLNSCEDELPHILTVDGAKQTQTQLPEIGNGKMDEKTFRYMLNMDGCGTDKMAEGIRAFIGETEKLEKVILDKVRSSAAE